MAEKKGKAGRSTYQMAEKRGSQVVFILVAGIVLVVVISMLLQNAEAFGIGGGGILLLLFLLKIVPDFAESKAKRKAKEERRAVQGAIAEERVEAILDELYEDYLVLHDVPSPYGNIDHVVIRRDGNVFLVETKAHGGQVSSDQESLLVNGHAPEKDFIAQCLRNTYWLRDEIYRITGTKPWVNRSWYLRMRLSTGVS